MDPKLIADEIDMGFRERLAKHRKAKGLTQLQLATAAGVHVVQIRRYEGGKAQPTLEALKNLALSLNVSADELVFDDDERLPDEELKREFTAISRFSSEEKKLVKAVLKGLILKHEAERWQ